MLTGPAGQMVVVETSTNLVSWLPVSTNTFGTNTISDILNFSDPQSGVSSSNGANWVQPQLGLSSGDHWLNGIAHDNGQFVAVGPGGTILQSGSIVTIAVAPKIGTGPLTLSLEGPTGLAYTIETSTDLISWQTLTNISAQSTNLILDVLLAASDPCFTAPILTDLQNRCSAERRFCFEETNQLTLVGLPQR